MPLKRIGLLGGSFDPVHNAHLRLALEVKQVCQLDEMRLVPARCPPHKSELTTLPEQRLAMLELALADCPELSLDARELSRSGPSYTVDTLQELREELGANASISWVIGGDSLVSLHRWSRWQSLTRFAHLLVVTRPGIPLTLNQEVKTWLDQHPRELDQLGTRSAGVVVVMDLAQLAISATNIRSELARGHSPQFLLPNSVLNYIEHNGLYGAC